jgi:hypothetical protein
MYLPGSGMVDAPQAPPYCVRKREDAMPFVPAPNIIELEIQYTLEGQQIENRVMVDNLAAVTPADLEEVAILGWNWCEGSLLVHLSSDLNLRQTVTTDLTAIDGGQFFYAPDTTTIGGVAPPTLPNECAFCVSLHSASRGRSARGRMYLPGITVSSMSDNNIVGPATIGVWIDDVQLLINTIAASGRQLVIVSYISGGVPRPGGPVYYPVLSAVATDNVIDSQRRRKPGVGT